jgi:putative membrane protein
MAFQRTRLAADRTLMAVMRTSLSLISFGFTIFQFFQKLKGSQILAGDSHAPRNFGTALVWLGVGMLTVGIVYHAQFMRGVRSLREEMHAQGLVHAQSGFPVSFTLLVALALLFVGFGAIASVTFHMGPFE